MCPYDIRRFVISGLSITQENNTFENECLFKLIIRRNITEIERVKSNATIDVEYGVKDCNFDHIYEDDVCQDQRNFSIIEEFDMNQIMCCRSMFYLNNSTKDIDPIKRLASKVNSVLFKEDPNRATGKISRILEYGMHNCVYYYKPSRCYFHYHNKTKKVLTVNEDINFVNVHANASTYDDIILYRASTKPVNQTQKIRPKQCFCFNIGGCETNDVGYVCNSIENTFLHCSCVVQPKYYSDYIMFLELKSGKNISYGDIYMPYCKEKQKNGTAIAKTSSDSFFCYESYTPPHGWNRVFIPNNSITEMGFYNDSSKNAPIKFSDCLKPESQCKWDKTGRYICCCRALYAESEPLPVIFCNNGSLLERFIISETWQNPKQFIASAQDRQLCDDAINDDVSVWDSDSLSNEMNPLCYFSMKFSNKSFNLNDVKSVHYSSSNMTRGDNIGVFSLLCQVKKWTPLENTKGCACRLIEPLLQKHRRKKIASELSCCCIARFANNFKQLAMDIVNKRTLPYKSQKIK
ncbi:hypothetical protein Ddc_17619 [Ditylenchus destructor]|nr:hypothetical protein Ddc_17619 [Ditylenchus destructor]